MSHRKPKLKTELQQTAEEKIFFLTQNVLEIAETEIKVLMWYRTKSYERLTGYIT